MLFNHDLETNTTISRPLHIQDATNYCKIANLKLEKLLKMFID